MCRMMRIVTIYLCKHSTFTSHWNKNKLCKWGIIYWFTRSIVICQTQYKDTLHNYVVDKLVTMVFSFAISATYKTKHSAVVYTP